MIGDRKDLKKREPKEVRHSNRKIVSQQDLDMYHQSASSGPRPTGSGGISRGTQITGGSILVMIVTLAIWFFSGGQGMPPDLGSILESADGGYSGSYGGTAAQDLQSHPESNPAAEVVPQGKKPYTVMVYMNGTNLESKYGCATSDLQEMVNSGFDSDKINLIVLTGGTARWKNNVISQDTSIYHIEKDGFKQISDYGRVSIADANLLREYVDFGIKNFPADKFAFIFWNHGGGTIHGYGSDENFGGANLSISEIENAFSKSAMTHNKFEFIGFDCCLMGTLETAYLLKPYARYMVASEEVEPGYGWDYNWLGALSDNPAMDGGQTGKIIVDKYVDYYKRTGDQATMAVIDLSKVDGLSGSFEKFMTSAQNAVGRGGFNSISQARKGTKSFGYTGEDRSSFDLVDIKHLAQQLESEFPNESRELIQSVENTVSYYRNSDNVANAFGISTYVPYKAKEMAPTSVEKYSEIGVMPDFTGFLTDFTQKLTGRRVQRSNITRAIPEIRDEDVFIKLSPEELQEINGINFVIWRQLEQGSDYFVKLGLESGVEVSEDGTITTQFDGYWATLGGRTACFYEVEKTGSYEKYSTPAVLNGQDVSIIVMFDDDNPDGKILGAIPPSPDGGVMAPKYLEPINPGDTLALKYFAQLFLENEEDYANYTEAEKWVTGEEFTVEGDLAVEIVPVDDELYLYGFWIEDTQGNNYYTDFIEIRY